MDSHVVLHKSCEEPEGESAAPERRRLDRKSFLSPFRMLNSGHWPTYRD